MRTRWVWWFPDPDEADVVYNAVTSWEYNPQGAVVVATQRPYEGSPFTDRSTWTAWGGLQRTEQRRGTAIDGELLKVTLYRYNRERQLVEAWEEDPEGTRSSVRRYTYDESAEQVTERQDHDNDGEDDRIVETTFDALGRKTRRVRRSGESVSTETWTYNDDGHLVEESWFSAGLQIQFRTEYDVASDGRRLASRSFRDEELSDTVTYTWDEDLLREEQHWSAEHGETRTTHDYDEEGIRTGTTELGPQDEVTRTWAYEADERGNVTRTERFDADGVWNWREIQAWDCFVPEPYPDA